MVTGERSAAAAWRAPARCVRPPNAQLPCCPETQRAEGLLPASRRGNGARDRLMIARVCCEGLSFPRSTRSHRVVGAALTTWPSCSRFTATFLCRWRQCVGVQPSQTFPGHTYRSHRCGPLREPGSDPQTAEGGVGERARCVSSGVCWAQGISQGRNPRLAYKWAAASLSLR